jgi:hypothetical protein
MEQPTAYRQPDLDRFPLPALNLSITDIAKE